MSSESSSDSAGTTKPTGSSDLPTRTHPGVRGGSTLPGNTGITGSLVGHYTIGRVIASGGMGVVYEATQENPRRIVALKVMKQGVASRTAMRRFEFESQILARLQHPGIAQIYEAGIHDDGPGGVPFFAMEYVPDALSITRYAHVNKLDVPARLRLFVQVCEAVNHGHLRGVIHRDLKPGNILIDSNGNAKVIDFGVARGTDSDLAATTSQTSVGELVGTLQYMSPEQCQADPSDLDTRSDVYALGVVLYELLAGRLPYDLKDTPYYEVPRVIREVPAPRLGSCDPKLRGDLETIVAKSLEKDRERRYGSALSLGEDITRLLRREPIQARPIGTAYRAMRFVQRERKLVILLTALLMAGGAALVFYVDAHRTSAEIARRETLQRASEDFLALRLRLDKEEETLPAIIKECDAAILSHPALAAPYALRANSWSRLGRPELARRDSAMALRIDPANSLAHRTLAFIHLENGRFDEARDAYRKGWPPWQDEHFAEDFHNRARLLRLDRQFDKALEDHNRAAAFAPKKYVVYQSRGITRYFAGMVDEAIDDWRHAAVLDPGVAVQSALWIWEARMVRDRPGDRAAAEEAIRDKRLERITHPVATSLLGYFRGEVSEAAVLASAETAEQSFQAGYYLGSHALALGRIAEARKLFERCAEDSKMHKMPEYDLAVWHFEQLEEP